MLVEFVHLHVHTEYSLLDGAARIGNLVKKAKEMGMTALAITDHGVMYGVIDFYKACLKEGIKPLIGCEVYVAPYSRFDKNPNRDENHRHLVLLAETLEGYRNLVSLVSLGFMDGFYYKPRVDKELLRQYSKGLIALSGCLAGEVSDFLVRDQFEAACQAAREYEAIFGTGNFYLEIQDHGLADQRKINHSLWKVHELTGIPLVATNDVHYVNKDDAFVQDVLLCIQTGKTLADASRMSFSSQELYLKSLEDMELLFGEHPEVLANTCEIARRCQVEFTFGEHYLPVFQTPEGVSLDQYLYEQCMENFPKFYPQATEMEKKRLDYELEVIFQTGFSGYFLIVADFCQYAREHGVAVGPGRGSAAASMVAYLLGITSVEPLTHDLLFERFLNPERISMPDIDIDFDPEGRESVIRYVTEKYGADKVCQIITFGTMGAKAALRDVGRVLGIYLGKVDKVAKAVPNDLGITLEKALAQSPELARMVEEDEEIHKLYDLARAVEGMPRHASTHAAGVVIAKERLTNYLPLQKTSDGFLMTQFPMKTVEEIGLLKMDFLGLRNLTILQESLNRIKETRGLELDLGEIPFDDPATFALLSAGNSTGVFQLESGGMRAILKDLKPSCFEDIVAVNALYRPGPMDQIPEFIRRKHGGQISYLHPKLEPILKSTYGIIVYQEQVMQIARELAGYSLGRADLLRRAMGKKKKEIMEEERKNFIHGLQDESGNWVIAGALKMGLTEQEAEIIFDLMAKFAEYGFNKGHATAYAVISYQTAYLKANYPLEFTTALLSTVMGSSSKISFYIQEARQSGIEVLPPDVQHSLVGFSIEQQAIRFGLGAVRNVGYNVIEKIIEARQDGPYKSLYDFCMRVDIRVLNKRVVESLIKAGAFQELCNRAQGLGIMDRVLELAAKRQKDKVSGQISFFDFGDSIEEEIKLPDLNEFSERDILVMEKEYLGIYLSGHPLTSYLTQIAEVTSLDVVTLLEGEEERTIILAGMITGLRPTVTKKGEMMASFVLEDLTGGIEVLVFPRIYLQFQGLSNDQVVFISGRYNVRDEEKKVFAEKIIPVDDYKSINPVNHGNRMGSMIKGNDLRIDNGNGQSKRYSNKQSKATSKGLFLRLPHEDNPLMEVVLTELRGFPGGYPVYFFFEESQKLIMGNKEFWVSPDDQLEVSLKEILGTANVVWKAG